MPFGFALVGGRALLFQLDLGCAMVDLGADCCFSFFWVHRGRKLRSRSQKQLLVLEVKVFLNNDF